jgi:4-oxalocrotonate tautomerase family enzyme
MPHVQITWVEGRTAEQKRKIAERVTAVLIEDGKAKRENIHGVVSRRARQQLRGSRRARSGSKAHALGGSI